MAIRTSAKVAKVFGTGLRHMVSVFIPSTVDISTVTDTAAYVDEALSTLSNEFGGASAVAIVGGWVAKDGTLVKEAVTRVYAYADSLTLPRLYAVRAFAEKVRRELSQEAVLVEIDNAAYFITE